MSRYRAGCAALITLATAVITISGCATTAPASRLASGVNCPAKAPVLATARAGTKAPVLPSAAAAATICQYGPALARGKAAAPMRRLVLLGTAADGLRAVLAATDPMTTQAVQCSHPANLPSLQVVYFGYRDGRAARAVVTSTDCQLTVVAAGSRFGLLPSPLQDDLSGYMMVSAHQRGPRVLAVIGLSARRAASMARWQHVALTVDGEVIDQAVPPGTIIFQVPPAMSDFGAGPYSLGTIVAVHDVPGCQPGQLRLSYRAGGLGAGSDFGAILLRDVTGASCRLAGRLQITGVSATGRSDTNTLTAAIASPGVLAPEMQPVGDLAPVPLGVLTWLLTAPYRDDPTSPDGLCIANYVIPVRWRIRLPDGSVMMTPNGDKEGFARLSSSGGLVTCRGRLGAISQVTLGGG